MKLKSAILNDNLNLDIWLWVEYSYTKHYFLLFKQELHSFNPIICLLSKIIKVEIYLMIYYYILIKN